ncbi:ubiquitin-like protein ATG12 [Caerostris extrusa]|uniref:Ubiquitin-like protein ATG12 n=1 Tax=Caerostris extrusa TaxID=172846 RepID=A0AAV4UNA5_CAEEX|nr:ubiquitin-like protein ATG12 [Caerostris extrusa]
MAGTVEGVTIKKEIEDPVGSPEQSDTPDSGLGQTDNQNPKLTKVWTEGETRSLIELAKVYIPKFKDSSYTKRQLLEDISNELQMIGYDTTPDHVRNKMKYLRTRYRNIVNYNLKHVEKRNMQFGDELAELYSLDYFDRMDSFDRNGNSSSDVSFRSSTSKRNSKSVSQSSSSKPVPASHVDLRTVVTTKKRKATQIVHKGTRFAIKRKMNSKSRSQQLFQCGLCMDKFKTSQDLHGHKCKATGKGKNESPKKKTSSSSNSPNVFHWNSLITMKFLELMKDYQDSHKNSNFRKGNLWVNMSALMKRRGYNILPTELEKKWSILSTAFEKTMKYNKTHKDKKKCAFFKRLTELHQHPSSFDCFKANEPVKMTVEVSPFSFASNSSQVNSRPSTANSTSQRKNSEDQKIMPNHNMTVWLKPTGNAPIIKNKKWVVDRNCTIAKIMGFLRQYMKLDSTAAVFLYVNQSFAPSPDSEVGNVFECFNINGKLVLYYSTSPAWG